VLFKPVEPAHIMDYIQKYFNTTNWIKPITVPMES
jgi:hypothetical protein